MNELKALAEIARRPEGPTMKYALISLFIAMLMVPLHANAASQTTIIFLHNAWYETNKDGQNHPDHGAYDFDGIKTALAKGGKVIAPERGPNTNPNEVAATVVQQIKELILAGHPANTIKIIGASKGGHIAQIASATLKNPDVKWVLVGGCKASMSDKDKPPKMTGFVLSLHEATDTVAGFCARSLTLTKGAEFFREVILSTGKNHGFQFTPDDAWITPALNW
ncbi:MAG: hypothetical protein AAFO75_04880 [Pseudomonadota bacterium]